MNDLASQIRRRSRAAGATAVVLALLLVPTLACAGTETTGSATPGRAQGDLVGMLPADVVNIGFFDYAALRNSSFFASIQDDESLSLDALDELDEFIDRTGMDPRTDIHQVAFVTGTIGGGGDNDGGFVAVANFDRARVTEALADFETMQHADRTVWILRDSDLEDAMMDGEDASDEDQEDAEDGNRVSGYLTIMSDDTIAAGSQTMVQRIIDVSLGAASARTNRALEGLIEDVDPDSELWFVSAQDRLISDMAPRTEGAPMPQIPVDKIRSLIFSARFSDGLALQLRGRTEAESDAKLLGDSINGMLAFGKMMVQSNAPEIFAILDEGIRAGSSGRDVTLRASLTVEQIDQLRAYAERTFGDAMEEQIGG